MRMTTSGLRRIVRTIALTACVLSFPAVARGRTAKPETRPLDPRVSPPSLLERTTGAEASIPARVMRA